MKQSGVTISAQGSSLAGTLITPEGEGPFPAALLLAGSGPLDRNGSMKGMAINLSADLAKLLAEQGWASLRFDKRGVGESTGDYLSAGLYDELNDARAACRWLWQLSESDSGAISGPCVVIGHSAGAMFAAELACSEPELAGAVLLGCPTQSGREVLEWQAAEIGKTVPRWVKGLLRLFGTGILQQQKKVLQRIAASDEPVMKIRGQKVNARWLREFMAYDTRQALSQGHTPLLAITGAKDIQVNPADLSELAVLAGERATVLEAPDVDHLLRHEPAALSSLKHYKQQMKKPVAPLVLDALTRWLSTRQLSQQLRPGYLPPSRRVVDEQEYPAVDG